MNAGNKKAKMLLKLAQKYSKSAVDSSIAKIKKKEPTTQALEQGAGDRRECCIK